MKGNEMNLTDLQNNRTRYVKRLVRKSDYRLCKKLDLVREQIKIAYETKNDSALAILQEAEDQIIEARQRKFDLGHDW